MPTTPIYALRYPAATDPADVPVDMSELALDVENKLGGVPVTSLPGSPVDGQVIRYKASANGPVWTFQYVAASTAPRWHFLGGAPLAASVGGTIAVAAGAYVDLGCNITAPLAGSYFAQWGTLSSNNTATAVNFSALKVGAGVAADTEAVMAQAPGANYIVGGQSVGTRVVTAAAGDVIKVQGKCASGAATFGHAYVNGAAWFWLLPTRVN